MHCGRKHTPRSISQDSILSLLGTMISIGTNSRSTYMHTCFNQTMGGSQYLFLFSLSLEHKPACYQCNAVLLALCRAMAPHSNPIECRTFPAWISTPSSIQCTNPWRDHFCWSGRPRLGTPGPRRFFAKRSQSFALES